MVVGIVMKLEWRVKKDNWEGTDHVCYAGRIPVARACYNTLEAGVNAGRDYRFYINLPGLRPDLASGTQPSFVDAKAHVEQAVKTWFDLALEE